MTFGLAFALAGTLLVLSGLRNRSITDILSGVTTPVEGGAGAAFTTALASSRALLTGGGGAAPDSPMKIAGGGGWGGAQGVVESLTRGLGLSTTSTKRSTRSTASGNVSDHWSGCRKCYAADKSGSVEQMDRAAKRIMQRLGVNYKGGPLSWTGERDGFRIQVLWRVADHYDHIHVGARAIGYTP